MAWGGREVGSGMCYFFTEGLEEERMTAPKEVVELVERFGRNRDAYCSHTYNETRLRIEFIDPFFGSG